jgi:hypothetical protein
MGLREVRALDLDSVDWTPAAEGGWRITADLTCADCGAYQAADSDPVLDKSRAVELAIRLFNSVGWRAEAETGRKRCPTCCGSTGP